MRMWLVSRRMLGFMDGKITKLEDTSGEEFEAWEMVNGLVLSWITHSLEKHKASTIVYTDLASIAWKDLEERFNQENRPLLYQLRYELYNLHQGNDLVSIYFNKMKTFGTILMQTPTNPHSHVATALVGLSRQFRKKERKQE